MDFRFTFKHMDKSPALADYARRKVTDAVQKYVPNPIDVHLRFTYEHDENIATCQVFGGEGFNFQVNDHGEAMYACVDRLVDKLEARLRKHKSKIRSHGAKDAPKRFNKANLHMIPVKDLEEFGNEHDYEEEDYPIKTAVMH